MFRPFRKHPVSGLCIIGTALALLLATAKWSVAGLVFPPTAQNQQGMGEKRVEVEPQSRMDPVFITKVTVGGREVQCGLVVNPHEFHPVVPFHAGNDWLQNMTIYLYNRTDKTIITAQVELEFPESGDAHAQPMWAYIIGLGEPATALLSGKPIQPGLSQKAISFAPNQTLVIHVGDYIDEIRVTVEHTMNLTMVTKCLIRRSVVFFDDGRMLWAGGRFEVPDPEHPGKWVKLDPNYFPGMIGRNWPPGYGPY